MEYRIVRGTIAMVEEEVKQLISEGWKPIGEAKITGYREIEYWRPGGFFQQDTPAYGPAEVMQTLTRGRT
jgi:hypothetical protein